MSDWVLIHTFMIFVDLKYIQCSLVVGSSGKCSQCTALRFHRVLGFWQFCKYRRTDIIIAWMLLV
jgi:hypothetical protein